VRSPALEDVLNVVVKQQMMCHVSHPTPPRTPWLYALLAVSNLEKRGSYTPRRAREQRAYRLVVAGGVAGAIGVVGVVLAAVGAVGAGVPVIALVVAVICIMLFRRMVGR
jgi:hypothetical protein